MLFGERDYLSRLITLLEYPFGLRGNGTIPFKTRFFSNIFPGAVEQKIGCDAFFVFRYNNRFKLLAVEGKYPRFHLPGSGGWDYKRGKMVTSHFSSQIDRQLPIYNAGVAVTEMFMSHDMPGIAHYNADSAGPHLWTGNMQTIAAVYFKTPLGLRQTQLLLQACNMLPRVMLVCTI